MFRRVMSTMLKRSVESAVQATAQTAAAATSKTFVQRFEVTLPTTIYVRASQSQVTVRRQRGTLVELSASLRASFGWELAAEQDEAGVYIVAKRKALMGTLSSANFTLTVPPEANLVFHLTPGSVRIFDIDGKLTIPGAPLELEALPANGHAPIKAISPRSSVEK